MNSQNGQSDSKAETDSGYTSKLNRRTTLKWLGVLTSAAVLPAALPACQESAPDSRYAPWPELDLKPVNAKGYGTDPNLITPAPVPWPRLMNETQLALTAVVVDIILPREGDVPSASEVGVVDLIDEWISAPYPNQQEYRSVIESGLVWLDAEAMRRFAGRFVELTEAERLEIVEDIAWTGRPTPDGLANPKAFFASLRTLVVGGFVTTPEGTADIGYQGNVPIAGDYPGPSDEAMVHLQELLTQLGLETP